MEFLAQVTNSANEWATPVTGAAILALLTALMKWFMSTFTNELKAVQTTLNDRTQAMVVTINEHTRSLERALDHNTRATLLMGIASEQSNKELSAKLKGCYEELERKSQQKDHAG